MGKGKRNKQLRIEDVAGAPKKSQNKNKKQSTLPLWAKRALCIVLLVAVLAGIIAAALIGNGAVLRSRILVESKSGKFDVNQQMATFILWYTMYYQARNEWETAYYQQYFGGSQSSILTEYQSPDSYGVSRAAYYTKEILNTGLYAIKDYLIELVAGADAALNAGLKYDSYDKQDAKDVVTWMRNLYLDLGFAQYGYSFEYFLTNYVGENFKESDIEDAAKVMIMYSKYSDHMNFNLQGTPSTDDLQNYINENPAGFFETKYYTFSSATDAMMREFFSDKFIEERFESTVAKHFAKTECFVLTELKDEKKEAELTAKLEELGLNTTKKYTKTTGTDGKATYSPELVDVIGEYIFSTSNKEGTFAAISGEKCAYLIYFEKTSTATEATIAYKEYKYEDYKDNLSEIENVKDLIAACIKEGENLTDFMTDNEKAADLLGRLNDDASMPMPEGSITNVITKKDTTGSEIQTILDRLYAKDTKVYIGWNFVVNNDNESYVVKVNKANIKDTDGNDTTDHEISYIKYTDDLFAGLLNNFEIEYKLYLLETKVNAPIYTLEFSTFEEKVVNWLLDENFKELVLSKYANKELDELLVAKADSNSAEILPEKLNALFANGVEDFTKSYATEKAFETKYDSAVYDYMFNSKNKDSASVIVGDDDRVFLVYVAPMTEEEEGHEGHDHSKTVHAAIKEYDFADYEAALKVGEGENEKTFREQILADLLAEGRKNSTAFKAAEDIAKVDLDALKATENPKAWENYKSADVLKPTDNSISPIPEAILNKIYPSGSKTEKIELSTNTYYQVDNNGTSYIFKVTKIDSTALTCTVEYQTFEDEEYYSYFRAIKSKLDASMKETVTTLKYPTSITENSYQDWLFKSDYTDGSRIFDRQKNDLTFIANVDSKNNVTSLTIYIVDEPAKQVNNEELSVYAAYQLFETEKDALKALKKLNGKTGFELLDVFSSLKISEKVEQYVEGGYYPGYVDITSPTIGLDFVASDITDENLKKWIFDAARKEYDVEIIESKDGKGYYLALFVSSEQAWTRSARTGWTEGKFTEHMKQVIADGNYEFNEKAMEKIEGVLTTTTA